MILGPDFLAVCLVVSGLLGSGLVICVGFSVQHWGFGGLECRKPPLGGLVFGLVAGAGFEPATFRL
jgi:hypothetical protein